MGSRRGSSAPVEGLQIVQVDSPEVRRKYEAQLEEVKLQAHARARELDKMLDQTRKELEDMGRKFAQAFAERTQALQSLEKLKAEKTGAPAVQTPAPMRPLGPSQASRVSALERENEKLRMELSAKREAAVRADAKAPAPGSTPLVETAKAWAVRNRVQLLLAGGVLAGLLIGLLSRRG